MSAGLYGAPVGAVACLRAARAPLVCPSTSVVARQPAGSAPPVRPPAARPPPVYPPPTARHTPADCILHEARGGDARPGSGDRSIDRRDSDIDEENRTFVTILQRNRRKRTFVYFSEIDEKRTLYTLVKSTKNEHFLYIHNIIYFSEIDEKQTFVYFS